MNALHEQFVTEARELIHQATDDLIVIEREGFSVERIDRVFRAFHTLKGSAGVVGLPALSLTLHAAEDLLAAIHAGRLVPTSEIVDEALACLDQISRWVDDFDAREVIPADAGEKARVTAERLRGLLSAETSAAQDRIAPGEENKEALPHWVLRLIAAQRADIARASNADHAALVAISYEPRAGCFFDGDDPLDLMQKIPALLAFHSEAREPWPPLAQLDPFFCNLRLQALSAAHRTEISDLFRLVPDQVRIVDVPVTALATDRHVAVAADDTIGLVRAVIAEQREVLRRAGGGEDIAGRAGSVTRVAINALHHGCRADLVNAIAQAGALMATEADVSNLLAALDVALQALAHAPPPPESRGPDIAGPVDPATDEIAPGVGRSLRIDEAKIDTLVNLAGELLVMKNSFAHFAARVEEKAGESDLARVARQEHGAIERLADEMHAAILQLRMVPVAQAFRSFPRLVRDMSRQLEKDIHLVTHGETVESDKAIVDRLFEPLLHLVRNALDHGVEESEQRRAAGKPASATVTMQASRVGERFVVEVVDDGRGIDPEIVRRKAGERRLMSADELASLADEQVIDLIFSPGFSTAAAVSDISGRGVGMDVVRTTIGQMGGRVSVASRVGVGTTVRLDLPLTVAMSRIMVVEAGGQVFGIPMDTVTETVRLAADRIHRIKNNRGFVLRERIVPVCSLAELMNLGEPPRPKSGEHLLVVTEDNGKVAALEVDAIQDRLEVMIKPMQGVLSNARGYAGTTLLGDGRVLLVLNLQEILP